MQYALKHVVIPILVLCGAVLPAASATALNEYCPVTTDEKVDPTIYVDYESQRVQFCCQRCKKKFLENPTEYVGNLPQFSDSSHAEATSAHDAGGHAHGTGDSSDDSAAHQSEEAHDHGKDHGSSGGIGRAIRFAGKFHPVVVHFPITLILVAALAEVIWLLTGRVPFSIVAHYGIRLGAVSVVAAVVLGWAAGNFANYPGELADALFFHRWLGTATGVGTVLAASASWLSQRGDTGKRLVMAYRTLLFLSAGLVGATGHMGAVLIYGYEHFRW
ncbi:MAG: hypothetical protein L3K26_11660 [Candidatus Hydrogenedentes bacterium]|nr:hypothetical protein [Candidatus Hydrogenedentota bacterium]